MVTENNKKTKINELNEMSFFMDAKWNANYKSFEMNIVWALSLRYAVELWMLMFQWMESRNASTFTPEQTTMKLIKN